MNSSNFIIIPKQIVTADSKNNIFRNTAIEIVDGKIERFIDLKKESVESYDNKIYHFPRLTLIPGFIQTHVHLCQTLFRGLADDLELLDWLKERIFPFENEHTKPSLAASAKLGIYELQLSGTTTVLDMGTINHHEVVFDMLIGSKMRAISGKCMMDLNDLYPKFKESTKDSLASSYELAKQYHNSENGKIKYGFAPRFVLSCSEELLKETYEMTKDFSGSIYHSHTSENKGEIEAVRKMHNMENIEYFNSIGVLHKNTVLAHGIHVSDFERSIIKETGTRIVHCPSANLKLGSGIANIPKYLDEGITISLGADGPPCNNNLSMFTEMRLAALIQKPVHGPTSMDAKTVFRLATIEGAKALGLENEIGSLEAGKKADMVLLDLEQPDQPLLDRDANIYSGIVYSASTKNVVHVMIEGKWVVKNKESLIFDKDAIYEAGRSELEKLLKRIC